MIDAVIRVLRQEAKGRPPSSCGAARRLGYPLPTPTTGHLIYSQHASRGDVRVAACRTYFHRGDWDDGDVSIYAYAPLASVDVDLAHEEWRDATQLRAWSDAHMSQHSSHAALCRRDVIELHAAGESSFAPTLMSRIRIGRWGRVWLLWRNRAQWRDRLSVILVCRVRGIHWPPVFNNNRYGYVRVRYSRLAVRHS